MSRKRDKSKAAYNTNLQMAQTVNGILRNMNDDQLTKVLGAYMQLMKPTEQEEMVVATDVLAQLAVLASKAITQEMVFRTRGNE